MTVHATLSPSSAHRWMICPGSVVLSAGLPDTSSEHADEGTAAHFLAACCLSTGQEPEHYLGRTILVDRKGGTEWLPDEWQPGGTSRTFVVDQEMADHVGTYVDTVRSMTRGAELMVEQRVVYARHLGVPEDQASGTADVVALVQDPDDDVLELQVHDLKYGRGVRVDAEENPQLNLYALGALDFCDILGERPARVRLVIHQPRLGHLSECVGTVEQLLQFGEQAFSAAKLVEQIVHLPPDSPNVRGHLYADEKACRWCKAKATCPALRDEVLATVHGDAPATLDEFEPATPDSTTPEDVLGALLAKVDLVETWCKAVRAEAERRLLAGQPVAGWKLVEGRRGARAWADAEQVEATLKAMRLKVEEMYDLKLISPTSAEKLAKAGAIGPRQWVKLQAAIAQPVGKPSVAPASDKRPPLVITPVADDFATVDSDAEALV